MNRVTQQPHDDDNYAKTDGPGKGSSKGNHGVSRSSRRSIYSLVSTFLILLFESSSTDTQKRQCSSVSTHRGDIHRDNVLIDDSEHMIIPVSIDHQEEMVLRQQCSHIFNSVVVENVSTGGKMIG